jgi:hypothetical protein
MKNPIQRISILTAFVLLMAGACKKENHKFGEAKAPSNLSVSLSVEGADSATAPAGNGSGKVTVNLSSANALTYWIDFGDGVSKEAQSGVITYKYKTPGTKTYLVTINAIGKGGLSTTTAKYVTVFVAFEIPANILQFLTNGSSRTWVTDKEAPGHFGVGPNTEFSPIWYSAGPNSRDACAYDDEITFTKDAQNNVSMSIDNKGQFFAIEASTSYYGFSGKDGCYAITAGPKTLAFMDASSGSTPAISTQIQFIVPGNGIINFGTGGTEYEILSITDNQIHLRNIGVDGNAWFMKLTPKK